MPTYRCRAPRDFGQITKGFEIQVCSTGNLIPPDLKPVLERMGFDKLTVDHFSSPCSWEVKKV